MQTWNMGRFLQQTLPRELDSLRLVGLNPVRNQGAEVWRSHFAPTDSSQTLPRPWGFAIDIGWESLESTAILSLTTFAGIAMPKDSRLWLERRVRRCNRSAGTPLELAMCADGTFVLFASMKREVSHEELELLTAPAPPKRAIERFTESYEVASMHLFRAWRKGVKIGQDYRALN